MINNLAIDQETGDLDETCCNIKQVTGLDAIAQGIATDLRLFLGEYWLDRSLGVPYISVIFKKRTDLSLVKTLLKNVVLNKEEVTDVTSFTITTPDANRTVSVKFSAKTTLGFIKDYEVTV